MNIKSAILTFFLAFIFLLPVQNLCAQQKTNGNPVLPSVPHQQWADAEIGVIFHFDVPNFVPDYKWRKWGSHPPASVFNPSDINTDQWISAAKAAGAKYAVLVAKHCSGFSLWPTEAHTYSVKNSPWKNGQGDIVKDFIVSCKKYGVRPGIYASASANGFLWVNNPGIVQPGGPVDQQTYNSIVIKQLTELWSNYGKLFEIWFDGGVQPLEEGGPDIASLLKKLQPDAIVFQGPSTAKNLIRWIGNEDGLAPYPNWSTSTIFNGNADLKKDEYMGTPEGKIWCPAETDFPLRTGWQGGWFWKATDQQLMSKKQLLKNYVTSVGRNSNMLIGIVVDTSGHVPGEDVKLLKEFGDEVKKQFSKPIATTSGSGNEFLLKLGNTTTLINAVVIEEDIAKGERVRKYIIEALVDDGWKIIAEGISVGHKHIQLVEPVKTQQIRLTIKASIAKPVIKKFSALHINID